MFADDICVFTPVLVGCNVFWILVTTIYAAELEIAFKCNKTIGVLFCPQNYKQPALSNDFLNGVRVQVCDQVKDLRTSQRRQYHQRRVVPPA